MFFSIPTFFSGLFALLGVGMYPIERNPFWEIRDGWKATKDGYTMSLKSSAAIEYCSKHPEHSIVFPQIIHSFHEFLVDGATISSYGVQDFSRASPFYEKPILKCSLLKNGRELVWHVTTYSNFFARLREWPTFEENPHSKNIFNVALNIAATAILIILSIFSALIYKNRVSNSLTYSLSLGSLILSGYFLNSINSYLGINYSMMAAHKIADSCVWIGALFFINAFYSDGYLDKFLNWIFRIFCIAGISIILLGNDGDQVQFGTMVPAGVFLYCAGVIVFNLLRNTSIGNIGFDQWLKIASITGFATFGLNDILNVMGIIQSEMLLSIGSVGGFFGLSISVSQAIEKTYDERDSLLIKLEEKVKEKTKHLEETLVSLKKSQAELVQSARLASLGTLSAGIAHEINNSINYVSGALIPLERKIQKLIPAEERIVIDKLFASIKEGTHLTVEIVKSLRNFTGLNQAKVKEIYLKLVVNSVLTILKSRTKNVSIEINIPDDLRIIASLVGLNQIFMNLFSNSLDALDKDPKIISVSASSTDSAINILFEDNGCGIPENILTKIFDPFFTTKDVGQGTGLGLHIVMKEIERHKGTIKVTSKVGVGSKFEINLPKIEFQEIERAA